MSISDRPKVERPHQFRFLLSEDEWEKLEHIVDCEGTTAATIFRAFIERRYAEFESPMIRDLNSTADALEDLARKVRARVDGTVAAARLRRLRDRGY